MSSSKCVGVSCGFVKEAKSKAFRDECQRSETLACGDAFAKCRRWTRVGRVRVSRLPCSERLSLEASAVLPLETEEVEQGNAHKEGECESAGTQPTCSQRLVTFLHHTHKPCKSCNLAATVLLRKGQVSTAPHAQHLLHALRERFGRERMKQQETTECALLLFQVRLLAHVARRGRQSVSKVTGSKALNSLNHASGFPVRSPSGYVPHWQPLQWS
eukprot:4384764-Amphidinium_carterae.1